MFNYVIKLKDDGTPTGYPVTISNFKNYFNLKADIAKITKQDINSLGYAPLIYTEAPTKYPWQYISDTDYYLDDEGYVRIDYKVSNKDHDTMNSEIRSYKGFYKNLLANYRYKVETFGVDISDNVFVETDRQSVSSMINMYNFMVLGFKDSIKWKVRDSWYTFSKTDFEEMLGAIHKHIDSAFIAENNINDQIDNISNIDELINYDILEKFKTEYDKVYNS